MELMEAILTRRSIRKYTMKPVPAAVVEELLKAAMAAPSARNSQAWHFIVIDRREVLDAVPKFHPYSVMVKEASFAILVCGDAKIEENDKYLAINCAAATQNLLLAAHANGIGAVWLGIYPREERIAGCCDLFKLPKHIIPMTLVVLGYPAEKKSPENRFNKSLVHHNIWGVLAQ